MTQSTEGAVHAAEAGVLAEVVGAAMTPVPLLILPLLIKATRT